MAHFRDREIFFFCAQTGVMRDTRPQAPSNYHWYWLPVRHRKATEEAVEAAEVGPHGLTYSDLFLRTIDAADLSGLEHLPSYAQVP